MQNDTDQEGVIINDLPKHIGIIMDGNGRWAKQRNLPRSEGHKNGVKSVKRIVEATIRLNIDYLTLYAFSTENQFRPQLEVSLLLELLVTFLTNHINDLKKQNIRLTTIGRTDELPKKVQAILHKAINDSKKNTGLNLCIALNYSSRTEVVDAVRSIIKAISDEEKTLEIFEWGDFASYLYTKNFPDPDLIIRTSGEKRVSNFMLLQSAYAEYFFSNKTWPEFIEDDLYDAVKEYQRRERRYGKVIEQSESSIV